MFLHADNIILLPVKTRFNSNVLSTMRSDYYWRAPYVFKIFFIFHLRRIILEKSFIDGSKKSVRNISLPSVNFKLYTGVYRKVDDDWHVHKLLSSRYDSKTDVGHKILKNRTFDVWKTMWEEVEWHSIHANRVQTVFFMITRTTVISRLWS